MFKKMKRKWQAKQNQKVILAQTWEIESVYKEFKRLRPAENSIEQLLKDLYEAVYVHVFLNKQVLKDIAFRVEHREFKSVSLGDSYYDYHYITIEKDAFLYQFCFYFGKKPYPRDRYICLQYDGLRSAQVYYKGEEKLLLLNEVQELKMPFSFKEDVPTTLQEDVNAIFSYVENLKNNAWRVHIENLKEEGQMKQEKSQKRKEILENYS